MEYKELAQVIMGKEATLKGAEWKVWEYLPMSVQNKVRRKVAC